VAIAPERALGSDLGSRFVLVLGPGNHVVYRAVTLGAAVGEMRVVTSGLKPGDRVVVSGIQKVKPGDEVKPIPVAQPLSTVQLKALEPTA
jgi:multidrug efflux system membrane fusion protein